MDRLIQISEEVEYLKKNKNEMTEILYEEDKKDLILIINCELLDIQNLIDENDAKNILVIENNIKKVKNLIEQVNREHILVNNSYNDNTNDYKFPDKIKEFNIKIKDLRNNYKDRIELLSKFRGELQETITNKQMASDKLKKNNEILNNKQAKINTNSEVLAVMERKSLLIKNKNKSQLDFKKKEQLYKDKILNESCILEDKIKELNYNKNNNFQQNLNRLEDNKLFILKNDNTIEYTIKIKENDLLIENQTFLKRKFINDVNDQKQICEKNILLYNNFINENDNKSKEIDDEYDFSLNLLDEKVMELTNNYRNIRDENIKIAKCIATLGLKQNKLELKIFMYKNNNKLEKEIDELNIIIKKEEDNNVKSFDNFKNIYDYKLDELNVKKFRFEKRLLLLTNQLIDIKKNNSKENEYLREEKIYLNNLLTEL
jgi:hypothetical protein